MSDIPFDQSKSHLLQLEATDQIIDEIYKFDDLKKEDQNLKSKKEIKKIKQIQTLIILSNYNVVQIQFCKIKKIIHV